MHPSHAFEWKIKTEEQHFDQLNHVNNVVYLQWVQDAAAAHWEVLSAGSQLDLVWVVRRHELDYLKPAFRGDELTAYTWVGESKGALSVRHVHIMNQKGALLLQAQTTWCPLDKKNFDRCASTKICIVYWHQQKNKTPSPDGAFLKPVV